jgi:hypothetical protein
MPMVSKVTLPSFVAQCADQMVPLGKSFSYFSALPLEETELRKLLYDPVAAVPPKVGELLPDLRIILVPHLENDEPEQGRNGSETQAAVKKTRSRKKGSPVVAFSEPARSRQIASATAQSGGQTFLFLAVKHADLAEYHYTFYNNFANLMAARLENGARQRFQKLVREELASETHGEVDEKSWRLKEKLTQRSSEFAHDTKPLQDYFRQALEDTLTLYLHGLCCDIDVESGPRQLASRYLRQRLLLLREMLPPPEGFALFPEEL